MNRSLIFTPLIVILVSLVGCRAQSERSNLQNSVTRLEQRLKNMDAYLESLQEGQKEQKTQQASAIQNKEREVQKLRTAIEQQEAAISKQREQLDRERTQMLTEMETQQRKMNAQREELLKQLHQKEEALHQSFRGREKEMQARMKAEQQALKQDIENQHRELHNRLQAHTDAEKDREMQTKRQLEEAHKAVQSMERKLAQQDAHQQLAHELADRLAQFEDRLAEVTQRNADHRNRTIQVAKELEIAQAKLAQAQGAAKSRPSNQGKEAQKAIALLAQERKDIARLRVRIQGDLAKARQGQGQQESNATRRLKAENGDLKKKLRAMEMRLKNQQRQREESSAKVLGADAQANGPNIVTLHGPHTTTTASTGSAHEHSSHDESHGAHDESESGNGSHAFSGIGTLIINAHDGTVNVHIHDAAPSKKSIPAPKTRSGFGITNVPPTGALFLPSKAGRKAPGTKARAALMMARDAFQQAKASKTDAKKKPARKPTKIRATKKKSPPKINDLMLSV